MIKRSLKSFVRTSVILDKLYSVIGGVYPPYLIGMGPRTPLKICMGDGS